MKLPDILKGKGLKKGEITITLLFQYYIRFLYTKYNEMNLLFPLTILIMVFHIIEKYNSLATYTHTLCKQTQSVMAFLSC